MRYEIFKQILNREIFDNSKLDLIKKIAENPDRYIDLFRPTKPKAKILQIFYNQTRLGLVMYLKNCLKIILVNWDIKI